MAQLTPDNLNLLLARLQEFVALDTKQFNQLVRLCTIREIPKNSYFCKAGDIHHKIGFVTKGFFKCSYPHPSGKEQVRSFHRVSNLVAPYAEIIKRVPSRCHIRAMQDSEVIELNFTEVLALQKTDPVFLRLSLAVSQTFYIYREQHAYDLLMLSAKERYLRFVRDYPETVELAHEKDIAGFLGINPASLSRIKKDLS